MATSDSKLKQNLCDIFNAFDAITQIHSLPLIILNFVSIEPNQLNTRKQNKYFWSEVSHLFSPLDDTILEFWGSKDDLYNLEKTKKVSFQTFAKHTNKRVIIHILFNTPMSKLKQESKDDGCFEASIFEWEKSLLETTMACVLTFLPVSQIIQGLLWRVYWNLQGQESKIMNGMPSSQCSHNYRELWEKGADVCLPIPKCSTHKDTWQPAFVSVTNSPWSSSDITFFGIKKQIKIKQETNSFQAGGVESPTSKREIPKWTEFLFSSAEPCHQTLSSGVPLFPIVWQGGRLFCPLLETQLVVCCESFMGLDLGGEGDRAS